MDIIESTARIALGFVATSCDPKLVLRARAVKKIIGSDKQIVAVLTAEGGGVVSTTDVSKQYRCNTAVAKSRRSEMLSSHSSSLLYNKATTKVFLY